MARWAHVVATVVAAASCAGAAAGCGPSRDPLPDARAPGTRGGAPRAPDLAVDGGPDLGLNAIAQAATPDGFGASDAGTPTLPDGAEYPWPAVDADRADDAGPAREVPHVMGRDCVESSEHGCACDDGSPAACYTGPAGTRGVGRCRAGVVDCSSDPLDPQGGAERRRCVYEVTPTAEACGNGVDDDCDGRVDEDCDGQVACPLDATLRIGTGLALAPLHRNIDRFAWTILAAPTPGRTARFWPDPPDAGPVIFAPFIVGTYTLGLTAVDLAGTARRCTTRVVAEPHGLQVQLTWDGRGDLDLHVHDGGERGLDGWFSSADCFYANAAPRGGTGPRLDLDDTVGGGPENVRMTWPRLGRAYTIGVHNYRGGAGRIATVKVFCGTATTERATFASRPLAGRGTGQCTGNDFWQVARVTFSSAYECTITPIDAYVPSRVACAAP